MLILRIGIQISLNHRRSGLVSIPYIVTQARIVQVSITPYFGNKIHLMGIAKSIECLLLLVGLQVALCQVVIGILGYFITPIDNLVELIYSLLIITLLIVSIAQVVKVCIGISPIFTLVSL